MQSKLVAAKDYHEVALDIPAFVPDQAALQKELDRLRNPYVTWEPGGTAAAGDMVRCFRCTLRCRAFKKTASALWRAAGCTIQRWKPWPSACRPARPARRPCRRARSP